MALQIHQSAQALGSGADLWIVPETEECELVRKVDWYLNFQLERAKYHKAQELSPELQDLLKQEELSPSDHTLEEKSPKLVVSQSALLTELVASIPKGDSQFPEWIQHCEKLWTKLGRPRVLIFLPKGVSSEQFKKTWREFKDPHEVSAVLSE